MTEDTSPQQANSIPASARRRRFRITLYGQFDQRWMEAFSPISVTRSMGDTTIEVLADQSGLRFILNRLWDLNCAISAVVEANRSPARNGEQ